MLKFCFLILTGLCFQYSSAQVARSSELYKTIFSKDSLLFEVGFNTCNIGQFEQLVSENFEFYHDKGGITPGKPAFIQSIRNNICNGSYKATRRLVPGSMQVFPLYSNGQLYGAIQNASHRFFESADKVPEHPTSTARFTHLWLLENGEWKLSRSLSFDHLPAPKSKQAPLKSPRKKQVKNKL